FLGKDYGHVQNYSEKLAGIIDEEVKAIIDEAYSKTLQILRDAHELLVALSEALLEKEKIEGPEFESLIQKYAPGIRPLPANSNPKPVEVLASPEVTEEKPADMSAEKQESAPSAEKSESEQDKV
ncbi:MAG: hflB, partial [Firmicutes bacterium]|nr:hflB [Bacillota bacterium]